MTDPANAAREAAKEARCELCDAAGRFDVARSGGFRVCGTHRKYVLRRVPDCCSLDRQALRARLGYVLP